AFRQPGSEIGVDGSLSREQRRADNHALRSRVEHLLRALDGMNAAARLHGQALRNLLDERRIISLPHRRVQIDELDERIFRKLLDPIFEIVERQAQFLTLHQLHNAPAHQIDRWNQHGSLTGTPALASSSLSE